MNALQRPRPIEINQENRTNDLYLDSLDLLDCLDFKRVHGDCHDNHDNLVMAIR